MFDRRSLRITAVAVLVVALVALVGTLINRRSGQPSPIAHAQQPPVEPGSIDDLVQRANANGDHSATLPIEIMHEDVDGFDDARTHYSIVVADAVSKQSFAISAYSIETWFKFTVTETILSTGPHICVTGACSLPAGLPAAGSNELWLSKAGGTIERNGVTVNFEWNEFPDFNIGQRYVLFIDMNQSTRVGANALGPVGVFMLDNNGIMAAVLGEDTNLKSDISSRFGNSLSQLRNAINPPPPPPSGCDPAAEQACNARGGGYYWDDSTCQCAFDVCIPKPWLCP
ncbi:MAG TPA: hypothetical protein VGJ37_05505 [Pyrinomonadaceae bacterium]|jgi:hypothetical protein